MSTIHQIKEKEEIDAWCPSSSLQSGVRGLSRKHGISFAACWRGQKLQSPLDMGALARAITWCLQMITAPSFIGTAAAFPKALSWEGTILLPWCIVALSALISRTPLWINNLWTGLKDCKVMGCGTSPAQAIITSWHRCVWGRRGSFSKVKNSTSRLSTTSHRTAWISNSFLCVCVCLSRDLRAMVPWVSSQTS